MRRERPGPRRRGARAGGGVERQTHGAVPSQPTTKIVDGTMVANVEPTAHAVPMINVTRADEVRFFTSTWRYFETSDRQFESPTPIQGRWKIDGVGLPESILRKIYFENAVRVLRWRPPGT